jgi:hypothetical protein
MCLGGILNAPMLVPPLCTCLSSRVLTVIAGLGILVILILVLWKVPQRQVASLNGLKPERRFDKENAARQTIAQIVGGLLLLFGFYFTWQNLVDSRAATEANLKIALENQITDRYTKAIDQLGAVDSKRKNLELRLGGIYALERIAKEDRETHLHGPIMEVLTAYIRLNAPATGERAEKPVDCENFRAELPPADIQAILTVIGRRKFTYGDGESQGLDLNWSRLDHADLGNARLIKALFYKSDLNGTYLEDADLRGAVLAGGSLLCADLTGVRLEGADLTDADLRRADFSDTVLTHAIVSGAKLTEVETLTQSQIDSAIGDEHTKIPDGLVRPTTWH